MASRPRAREWGWLCVVLAAVAGSGVFFAHYLVTWDDEWSYVFLGLPALTGQIGLFQDEMLGARLPLPFYVIGVSQWLAGPSLLAARLWSVAFGVAAVGLTFLLGRAVGGPTAGFLSALFVAAHPGILGYFSAASYYAFCAVLILAGSLAVVTARGIGGRLLGMACFSALALSRANLAVIVPAVLVYLVVRTPSWWGRGALAFVAGFPFLAFLMSSPDHLKVLAYVPVVSKVAEPLGYRSLFALGGDYLMPERQVGAALVWFAKRHGFWVLSSAVILAAAGMAWWRARGRSAWSGMAAAAFAGGLAVWALAWQVVIFRMYLKTVAAYVVPFAPLWAVVLGYLAARLLEDRSHPRVVRYVVGATLVGVFALSPSLTRHAAMPWPLPPGKSTVERLAAAAGRIQAVIPSGERVFLFGGSMPAYLAGVEPYLQQVTHWYTLSPASDARSVRRSGMWGYREMEAWLGREARYALVQPNLVEAYRSVEAYRGVVEEMTALLATHFEPLITVDDFPWARFVVYRRRADGPEGQPIRGSGTGSGRPTEHPRSARMGGYFDV